MINARGSTRHNAAQKGFTLLELLLSIGLLALLLAGLYQLFDAWSQRSVNRIAATDMLRVQIAAQDYIRANFEERRNTTTYPLNVFQELDIQLLRNGNYLPSQYQARNVFRQRLRVYTRNTRVARIDRNNQPVLNTAGNPVYVHTIEVLSVSDQPATGQTVLISTPRLLDIAQAGGPKMGIISNVVHAGISYTGLVASTFGEWSFARSLLPGYSGTPSAQGGYLAVYGRVNAESTDVNEAWLYRVDIDGHPDANRMRADLRMNQNRLQNIGTMVADRISVQGNAAFRGTAQGSSATAETAQAMTVEQAFRVDGPGTSNILMRANNTACNFDAAARTLTGANCNISGGEVQVIAENVINPVTGVVTSTAGEATMDVGALSADGSVITDFTTAAHTTSRGVSTFNTARGTQLTATSRIMAPTTTVRGDTVRTQELQTGTMALSNSGVGGAAAAIVDNSLVTARFDGLGAGRDARIRDLDVGNVAKFTGRMSAAGARASLESPGGTPTGGALVIYNAEGSFTDAELAGSGAGGQRNIQCFAVGARTYCEPRGFTYYGGVTTRCQTNDAGNGYECFHTGAYTGYCNHVRSISAADSRSIHTASCCAAKGSC